MKKIKLTQGKFALVDNADFKKIALYHWYYNNGYAVRKAPKQGKQIMVYMHRFILNTPDGLTTDHKDGNRLNNQRHNLRICTQSQNMSNTKLRTDNTTGFKGVTFCKALNKFQAQIKLKSKNKHLGYFKSAKDAAKAYNKAAIKMFGEFAKFKNPTGQIDWQDADRVISPVRSPILLIAAKPPAKQNLTFTSELKCAWRVLVRLAGKLEKVNYESLSAKTPSTKIRRL